MLTEYQYVLAVYHRIRDQNAHKAENHLPAVNGKPREMSSTGSKKGNLRVELQKGWEIAWRWVVKEDAEWSWSEFSRSFFIM